MPVWERYHGGDVISTAGGSITTEIFANAQADENFEAADLVIVDGIITFLTDTDDLCGARLLVVPEEVLIGALTEDAPQPHSDLVYYSWFLGRGPMVFRLRSKRTVPPEHKLYMQTWKAVGSATTTIQYGMHLLFVLKH